MKVRFDYGEKGLNINIKDEWNVDVLKPKSQEIISDPINQVRNAIKNPIGCPPLGELIKQKESIEKVCIVVSDATRPVPSSRILDGLVSELVDYGIEIDKIFILIATGLHRISRKEEIKRIVGKNLYGKIQVIDHRAKDDETLTEIGKDEDGTPILINSHFMESDLKILTGYVEPHFFAGFSGGRKSVVPGIAGQEMIQKNHSAKNIASPFARFGFLENNPIHEHSLRIAKQVNVDFIVNVCINEEHKITRVAAGDLEAVHEELVKFQKQKIFHPISELYDIVVCGNGGYPLDLNLYQAVKSMAIGEMAVKKSGTIISVNQLSDGVGIGQDEFKSLINSGQSPKQLYEGILKGEIRAPDQWEIQVLARVLMHADIVVVSSMEKERLGNIGLKYSESVENAIQSELMKKGNDVRILILPNGPQVIPIKKTD